MLVVALTGGIGSGKTTVADMFAALGAGIVDTDSIAHALTAPHGAALEPIAEAFGNQVISPEGGLDRKAMRELVFRDASQRHRLEALLHPMIREESERQLRALETSHPYLMLVIPLLVESKSRIERASRVLVVDCDEATQIQRVMQRNGLAKAQVQAIMAAQASRAERLAAADDVIDNAGEPALLAPLVKQLHEKYCNLQTQKGTHPQ